jgi:glycosyltransferase involved in cell wall biosynthesis
MVNVTIPCYNSSEVLQDALNSLVAQTKKMFTVTVVDDCSTEDIKSIVNSYQDKLHITYLKTEKNGGPGAARNLGIEHAIKQNYDYIMFLDADDMLYPRAVDCLYSEAKRKDADVVFTDITTERKSRPPIVITSQDNITWVHGKIYKTNFLKNMKIRFFNSLRYNEDGAFNAIIFTYGKTYYIPERVYLWRDYSNSITRSTNNDFKDTNYNYIILSMYEVLKYFSEKNQEVSVRNCINNFYQAYELQKARKIKNIDVLKEKIIEALNFPMIEDLIKKEKNDFLDLPQGIFYYEKMYYFENSIYDWFKEMGKEYLLQEDITDAL